MNLLNNPLAKNLIKNFLPDMLNNLDSLETELVKYSRSFPIEEGETHTVLFTDVSDGKLFFCVGAFNKKTMVRLIEAKPATEFIKTLLETAMK